MTPNPHDSSASLRYVLIWAGVMACITVAGWLVAWALRGGAR